MIVVETQTAVPVRLGALTTLRNIGTHEAIQIIIADYACGQAIFKMLDNSVLLPNLLFFVRAELCQQLS